MNRKILAIQIAGAVTSILGKGPLINNTLYNETDFSDTNVIRFRFLNEPQTRNLSKPATITMICMHGVVDSGETVNLMIYIIDDEDGKIIPCVQNIFVSDEKDTQNLTWRFSSEGITILTDEEIKMAVKSA